ncbi:MAG TPA: alpha-amylase family glycosyl hydrolase, partial [Desulfuromonadaceae bacterium]|nr:alpha-amylase family glycosyl hydrolase [Desulfuromonadaceae bacterium]
MRATTSPRSIVPRATYRFQFNEHFRLADALALVPYLSDLGISHVYASPLFQATAHSVHGYDVCDYSRLNPEIGTETDLEKLVGALHARGMGLVVDIVPNHMGVAEPIQNGWWWDVLKNGRDSRFADHFDINWEPTDGERSPVGVQASACPSGTLKRELQRASSLHGKVLLPVLGDTLERVMERGELKLAEAFEPAILAETGKPALPVPVLRYFEHVFPIAPESSPHLTELIRQQHYVLAPWWEEHERLNYRRFFAVGTLAAVRQEDQRVFDEAHSTLRRWVARGWIDGLRVDHPDGLRLPKEYLERLRALAPKAWITVEKILQPKESVPEDWPVDGTVGYDFLNQANGLFIDQQSERALTDFYAEFTGEPTDACRSVQEKKRLVLQTLFATEVNRLVGLIAQIAAHRDEAKEPRYEMRGTGGTAVAEPSRVAHHATRYTAFTREQWREALIEFAASFPVYRTYVRPADDYISETDFVYIKEAAA